MAKIPPALIGTLAPILANAYTHAQLNSLFLAHGFPGVSPNVTLGGYAHTNSLVVDGRAGGTGTTTFTTNGVSYAPISR